MVSFIATDASPDLISFTIRLITSTSTILIISPMITFISTTLIISMIISIYILIISMIISISIMLIISLMIMSISSILIIIGLVGSFGLANTEGFLFWFFLHSLCAVHVLLSDLFLTLSQFWCYVLVLCCTLSLAGYFFILLRRGTFFFPIFGWLICWPWLLFKSTCCMLSGSWI